MIQKDGFKSKHGYNEESKKEKNGGAWKAFEPKCWSTKHAVEGSLEALKTHEWCYCTNDKALEQVVNMTRTTKDDRYFFPKTSHDNCESYGKSEKAKLKGIT